MDERARRVGQNEALFRQVNERVRGLSETFGSVSGTLTLVCECGDAGCAEEVTIDPEQYAAVREDPLLFVIKPGHEAADVEEVVERNAEYDVVRKHRGSPANLAHATRPPE